MNISFDRDLAYYGDSDHLTLFINVTCEVNAADGKPAISLYYYGKKGTDVKRVDHETQFKYHDGHVYGGIHREEMILPTTGYISCRVTDARGKYTVDSPIVTQDSGKLSG